MVHLYTSLQMVNKSLIYDVTDPNNKLLEMVSLFYLQEVLEIAFWSTELGPLAFGDNRVSSSFLFEAIKMSYWSLLSSLEMVTLIFDASLYGIYWNFSLVYIFFHLLHMILYLQHFFWIAASVNYSFASGENVIVYFFLFNLVYKSFGKKLSTFDYNFLKMCLFGKPGLDALTSGSVQGREGRGRVGEWNQPGCSTLLPSLQNRAWRQLQFSGI